LDRTARAAELEADKKAHLADQEKAGLNAAEHRQIAALQMADAALVHLVKTKTTSIARAATLLRHLAEISPHRVLRLEDNDEDQGAWFIRRNPCRGAREDRVLRERWDVARRPASAQKIALCAGR
jgi:hypothetical protein